MSEPNEEYVLHLRGLENEINDDIVRLLITVCKVQGSVVPPLANLTPHSDSG